MCKQGDTVIVLTSSGKLVDVDRCIFDLVQTLNDNYYETVACCCGHGYRPGVISLKDGRELIIAKDYKEARSIDALFPTNIQGVRKNNNV